MFKKPLTIPSPRPRKGSFTSPNRGKSVKQEQQAKMTFADNMTALSKITTTTNEKNK